MVCAGVGREEEEQGGQLGLHCTGQGRDDRLDRVTVGTVRRGGQGVSWSWRTLFLDHGVRGREVEGKRGVEEDSCDLVQASECV